MTNLHHTAVQEATMNGNGFKAIEFLREYFPKWHEMIGSNESPIDPRAVAAYVALVTYMAYGEQESNPEPKPRVYFEDKREPISSWREGDVFFFGDEISVIRGNGFGKTSEVILKDWRPYFHNQHSQIGAWVRALYAMGRQNDDEPVLSYEDVF